MPHFKNVFWTRITTDHNEDNTSSILREWVANVKPLYHRVLINVTASPKNYIDASQTSEWTDERYYQVALLRQRALDSARKQWADYLFVSQYYLHEIDLRQGWEEGKKECRSEQQLVLKIERYHTVSVFKMLSIPSKSNPKSQGRKHQFKALKSIQLRVWFPP